MANLVIAVDGARFKVTSNDIDTGWDIDFIWPQDIEHVTQNGRVVLSFHDERHPWEMSYDGGDYTWKIDSVSGTPVTDNTQLAILIADLKG